MHNYNSIHLLLGDNMKYYKYIREVFFKKIHTYLAGRDPGGREGFASWPVLVKQSLAFQLANSELLYT